MIRLAVILGLLATPAVSMSARECNDVKDSIAAVLPAAGDVRLLPGVTDDGWCRVIDGPFGAGLEWRGSFAGGAASFEVRQERFAFEGLGPFQLSGKIETPREGALEIGPVALVSNARNRATFSGEAEWLDASGNTTEIALTRAALTVTGDAGLIDEVLAWAFRFEVGQARSNLLQARDQRDAMGDWLETTAAPVIDETSVAQFRELIAAYPNARGTAQIGIRTDQPVTVGKLVGAVLFGSSFSESEAAALVRDAGLRFTWQPE